METVKEEIKKEEPKMSNEKFDIIQEHAQKDVIKKPAQKIIKKKLGANRIDKPIDFNSLVTDDLKLKEIPK